MGVLGLILAAFAWAMVFPVLARYTQKTPALLKNAVTVALTNPHIVLLGWAAALLFPAMTLAGDTAAFFAIPCWALLGGTLPALVMQLLLRPVYRRLEQPQDGQEHP